MKMILKDAWILFLITLTAGLVLGFVYQITKNPIEKQEEKVRNAAYVKVFPDAESFETINSDDATAFVTGEGFKEQVINEVLVAKNEDLSEIGYVIDVTTKEGYAGDIQFLMGIRADGTLNGISILSITETPGLGMKATEILAPQFTNKKVEQFEYMKSGAIAASQIDAISGATITTKAVTNGVNAGLLYFQEIQKGGSEDE